LLIVGVNIYDAGMFYLLFLKQAKYHKCPLKAKTPFYPFPHM